MTLCEYSDEIYKACAAAADDPDPRVRQNVPACLLWNLDNDAADGKSIIVRMTEDEEPGVRVQAVMALANCGDTSVIPLAEEILKDFSLDYLHTKAALALCDLWYNGVYSEEAYRVSLNYLQGDKMDWLTEVTLLNPFSDGVDEEWAANAPWFDKAELVSVLEKISRNEELGSFITDEAAKTLESLG